MRRRRIVSERTGRWATQAAIAFVVGLLLLASLSGAVITWQVAEVFRTGQTIVRWQDGPDLVVMAAPILAFAVSYVLPRAGAEHPLGASILFILLIVLFGAALGKGDALLLEQVAASHGYHYCEALDVWDAHGGRGGGPALRAWGYSRAACPESRPATKMPG